MKEASTSRDRRRKKPVRRGIGGERSRYVEGQEVKEAGTSRDRRCDRGEKNAMW